MFAQTQKRFLAASCAGLLALLAVRGADDKPLPTPDLATPLPEPDFAPYLELAKHYKQPVREARDPDTGFVVGGQNDTATIRRLTTINGRTIAELEALMRPGSDMRPVAGRKEQFFASEAGFLGKDEKLLDVLAADNDFVTGELKTTHQAIARVLHDIGSIALWSKAGTDGPVGFTLHGVRFRVRLIAWRGLQHSPFLDGTSTNCDVIVTNLDNGKAIAYSLLVPDMIERYGFYEGRTSYRVDPKAVVAVFPFLVQHLGSGPITASGTRLAEFLDGLSVEKLWLPKQIVEWETGKKIKDATDGQPHTHCSAFAAAVCERKGVYLLRPPEHSATHLANAQSDWLREHGAEKGWAPVATAAEAQRTANHGHLVVAVYRESNPNQHGHIAVVRPGEKDDKQLRDDGPQVIQAGLTNANSTTLKVGFQHHPDAFAKNRIRFYVHELTWK